MNKQRGEGHIREKPESAAVFQSINPIQSSRTAQIQKNRNKEIATETAKIGKKIFNIQ